MKTLVLFLYVSIFFTNAVLGKSKSNIADKPDILLEATENCEFYSNYWVNLHHFLYQQAKRNQLANIKGTNDTDIILQLDRKALEVYEETKEYYRQNFIQHHLLFDLGPLKLFLQNQKSSSIKKHSCGKEYDHFIELLNQFSKVYDRHFWAHQYHLNKQFLNAGIKLIRELEPSAIPKLSQLA